MSTPYRQSFGEDSWQPDDVVNPIPACARDDEYFFEDEDWDLVAIDLPRDYSGRDAFLYYDRDWKKWKCTCKKYRKRGSCFHSSRMRREETVIPNVKYL